MESTLEKNNYIKFGKYEALVLYPANFSACAQYPVFIGISGGIQSKENIPFFEEVYFTNKNLDKYFRVLPIADGTFNYHSLSKFEILDFINQVQQTLNVVNNGWLIAGTSNGGNAAFNFIAATPKLFNGVIAMPGGIGDNEITIDWKHLNVILAHGVKDSVEWQNAIIESHNKLIENDIVSEKFILQGAAHIIKKGYSLNALYNLYFNKSKNGITKK